MATVTPTEVQTPLNKREIRIYKWPSVAAGDDCTPVICGQYTDKTVYMLGTFGGNMSLEGSPDPEGSTYVTLEDAQGTAIAGKSANFKKQILDGAYKVRPVAAAGVTAVDVYLILGSTK